MSWGFKSPLSKDMGPVSGKLARLTSNERQNKLTRGPVRPARPVVRDRKRPRKGV